MKSNFDNVIKLAKPLPKRPKPPYKVPKWFKRLPVGSHGSTPSQKKAWKVVSDYVRERDFTKYGTCVSCYERFSDWKNGHAGHYKPWTLSNGLFKYDVVTISLQCATCNWNLKKSDAETGARFKEELERRHKIDIDEYVRNGNTFYKDKKIEEWELVEMVAKLRPDLIQ